MIRINLHGARTRRSIFRQLYKAISKHWRLALPNYERLERRMECLLDDEFIPMRELNGTESDNGLDLLEEFVQIDRERRADTVNSNLYLEVHALYAAAVAWFERDLATAFSESTVARPQLYVFHFHYPSSLLPHIDGVTWSEIGASEAEADTDTGNDTEAEADTGPDLQLERLELTLATIAKDGDVEQVVEQHFQPLVKRLARAFMTEELLLAYDLLIARLETCACDRVTLIQTRIDAARWMIWFGDFARAHNMITAVKDIRGPLQDWQTQILELELMISLNEQLPFDGFAWLTAWRRHKRTDSVMAERRDDVIDHCDQRMHNHRGVYQEWMRSLFQRLANRFLTCYKRILFEDVLFTDERWRQTTSSKHAIMATYTWMSTLFSRHKHLFNNQEFEAFRDHRTAALTDYFDQWEFDPPHPDALRDMLAHIDTQPFIYLESPDFSEAILDLLLSAYHQDEFADERWLEMAARLWDIIQTDEFFTNAEPLLAPFFDTWFEKIERVYGRKDVRWYRVMASLISPTDYLEDMVPVPFFKKTLFEAIADMQLDNPGDKLIVYEIALENDVIYYDSLLAKRILKDFNQVCEQVFVPRTIAYNETKQKLLRHLLMYEEYDLALLFLQQTINSFARQPGDEDDAVLFHDCAWRMWNVSHFDDGTIEHMRVLICEHWLKHVPDADRDGFRLTDSMFDWASQSSHPEALALTRDLHANLLARAEWSAGAVDRDSVNVSPKWFRWLLRHGTETELRPVLLYAFDDFETKVLYRFQTNVYELMSDLENLEQRFAPDSELQPTLRAMWNRCMSWIGPQHPRYLLK